MELPLLSFQNFQVGGSDFSHKKGGVGLIVGVVLKKKGGVLLTFILTNPFQCYLSLNVWWVGVCVFCLFTPFLSVLFVFHRKTLVI